LTLRHNHVVAHLADVLDTDRLAAFIEAGLITRRVHPTEPLAIYDYTPRASYSGTWTAETRLCRGLIADFDGEIVARPFAKFFGLGEEPFPLDRPFEVLEKMDGSLGILYRTTNGPAISTRGTFDSDQARWATAHWRATYGDVVVPDGVTYLFEIIYPDNRIVVDYGGFAGLVLLAVIDTTTGADLPVPTDWGGPVVPRHDGISHVDAVRRLLEKAGPNREGFVMRFSAPAGQPSLRVKAKFADYQRLHRIVTGSSAKTIWAHLAAGESLDALVDRVPDDFARWVQATAARLNGAYAAIERECRAALAKRPDADRRTVADYFQTCGVNTAVLFKMLDGRAYDDIIWRALRPDHERPFRVDADAGP
jgi:RNA ligase